MSSTEKSRILIADPEIFNQATLIGTLKDHYHVAIAQNSADIFKAVTKQAIDLILLDTRYPAESGFAICSRLKNEESCREIPVIFLTSDASPASEEKAFNAGAADYIAKPYNAPSVLARIKNQLRLTKALTELKRLHQLALDANPNTGLPGNNSIRNELEKALTEVQQVCVIYADLDHFKVYNDTYGFAQGDDLISFTANVIRVALQQNGCGDSFLGHIGGDDFVFIAPAEKCATIAAEIIRRIDMGIREFYNAQDIEKGYVVAYNREGEERRHPLVSLSMGGVDLTKRQFASVMEVIDICTETKKAAKNQPGSSILICQRSPANLN